MSRLKSTAQYDKEIEELKKRRAEAKRLEKQRQDAIVKRNHAKRNENLYKAMSGYLKANGITDEMLVFESVDTIKRHLFGETPAPSNDTNVEPTVEPQVEPQVVQSEQPHVESTSDLNVQPVQTTQAQSVQTTQPVNVYASGVQYTPNGTAGVEPPIQTP